MGMTARDVLDALHRKWPDSEHLKIEEAPQSYDRQGRKIDLLVIGLWASRGFERHAVEVKVSMSDWKRELDEAAKADWWFHHTHRFWVSVPSTIAPKVREQLPEGWGLISIGDAGATRELVKATKHAATDFTPTEYLGIIRASANAGRNALFRAEETGYRRGKEAGKAETVEAQQEGFQRDRADNLMSIIERFEKASGLRLATYEADNLGRLARYLQSANCHPQRVTAALTGIAANLDVHANTIRELQTGLASTLEPPNETE